jgi:hypothetical protein
VIIGYEANKIRRSVLLVEGVKEYDEIKEGQVLKDYE